MSTDKIEKAEDIFVRIANTPNALIRIADYTWCVSMHKGELVDDFEDDNGINGSELINLLLDDARIDESIYVKRDEPVRVCGNELYFKDSSNEEVTAEIYLPASVPL